MLLIKNANILEAYTKKSLTADILIGDDGKIINIGQNIIENCTTLDATGLTLTNGLIDAHVHLRDPGLTHKEDIFTGVEAAKKGGFTTVICMANTVPTMDNVETLKYFYDKASKCDINVLTCAAVTHGLSGQTMVDFDELIENGAIGFTDDGINLTNASLCLEAMQKVAKLDTVISVHEEDPSLVYSAGVNFESDAATHFGVVGASCQAEESMIGRDIALALSSGAKVCFQHISSKNSVKLIRAGKDIGAFVYGEVTPHHISLTQDDVIKFGVNAKMNPPLRTEEDRQALINGLRDGTIDIIATDHAPHTDKEKNVEFAKAPSGIIGLETAFSVCYTYLVKTNELSLLQLIEKMSVNPAKLYNLENKEISIGNVAELCIIDENAKLDTSSFISKSNNSPYLNTELYGIIKATIKGDKIVYMS